MFWAIPLALAALGAGVGAATNKKNPGKAALKGALLGASLGAGAAGLGIGAGGAAQTGYASTIEGLGMEDLGMPLTAESTAAGSATAAELAGVTAAKQGILKGFMSSELGKGMMNQMGRQLAGSMLGGNQQSQQTAEVGFPSMQAQYNATPLTTPLAFASPQGQMQQELFQRRMMGYGY